MSIYKKEKKTSAKHETRTFWQDHGWNIELIPARMTIYWICIFCFWRARSSRWQMLFIFQMFFKIGALENSWFFKGKAPVLEYHFNKVVGLHTCNFFKNRLQHRCFPVTFTKFLIISFLKGAPSVSAFEWSKISPNYSFFSTLVFFDEFIRDFRGSSSHAS